MTDNTALAYPSSTSDNLTDDDFTKVDVYEGCICDIDVETGCNYVTLSWDDTGADTYVIFRSVEGLNAGYEDIGRTDVNSKKMGSYVMGTTT